MTRDDALQAWDRLLLERGRTSVRTRESYRQVLKRLAADVPLTDPPEQVATALQQYRSKLQKQFESGAISRSYIRLQVAAIKSFYRTLVDGQLYPADPTTSLRSIASDEGAPRPLSSQDVDRLFSAVTLDQPNGLRDLSMMWLYYHSLRNSEVANLRTDAVQYSSREDSVVITFKAKGNKTRTVVLVAEAAYCLAELLLRTYGPEDWDKDVDPVTPEYLFKALDLLLTRVLKGKPQPVFLHHDKPMTRRESNRIFAHYRDKAGLVSAGPHSLRHTCATNLLNADVDLRTVQEILGHTSVRQTQRYTAVLTSRKQQAMNRLPRPAVSHG
jgi:site-specific recombinase XerD